MICVIRVKEMSYFYLINSRKSRGFIEECGIIGGHTFSSDFESSYLEHDEIEFKTNPPRNYVSELQTSDQAKSPLSPVENAFSFVRYFTLLTRFKSFLNAHGKHMPALILIIY